MSEDETTDDALAAAVHDYHRRRGLGEPVSVETYREMLGDRMAEFEDVLAAESVIDALVDPVDPTFPRPFGEYTLLRELGRGAMGVVYEAVHRSLGRKVALKVLRTGFDTERDAIERFRREARACAQVKHPHIVPIYDAGEVDGRPYYSMELLAGRSLDAYRDDDELLDYQVLCEGIAGVADALATLHDAGIIHRDVKPSNIMVKPDGTMVLADFGLARTVDSEKLTATGQALGTPLYMSPEQVLGKASEIDGRADVYGLGASIYEVLAGCKLYECDGMPALLRAVLHERPEPLRTHRPDLPRDVDHVVMKTLEKEQKDRYESAHELAAELRRLAAGEAVEGRAVSGTMHVMRRSRTYLPIAAGLLVAVGFGAWYLVQDTEETVKQEIATAQAVAEVPVTVRCVPAAEVIVNGEARGTTPARFEVKPGAYELVLRQEGFKDRVESLDVQPGVGRDLERVLLAVDPSDPRALAMVAKEMGIEVAALDVATPHRGAGDPAFVPVFPRGLVRRADLATLRIDVSIDFEPGGNVTFRRGDDVLHSFEFDPEEMTTVVELPAAVRDALAVGETVSWGYEAPGGEGHMATFELAADDVAAESLAMIEKTLGEQPALAGRLRSRVLLQHGLAVAAYEDAVSAAASSTTDVASWKTAQAALDALDLTGSTPWIEAANQAIAAENAQK